jgi:hypothetical protein
VNSKKKDQEILGETNPSLDDMGSRGQDKNIVFEGPRRILGVKP